MKWVHFGLISLHNKARFSSADVRKLHVRISSVAQCEQMFFSFFTQVSIRQLKGSEEEKSGDENIVKTGKESISAVGARDLKTGNVDNV